MYLLYLDESGNESDPNDQYFVLAGIALFERQTYYLSRDVEAIQNKHFPNHHPITFWGSINNLADIPYFASMQEPRLLQLADLVAHAVWLLYEKRNPRLIQPLLRSFDRRAGTLHGLVHIGDSRGNKCECPACASRRLPGTIGKWIGTS